MSQYLTAIQLPSFNLSAADEAAMGSDIDTLNEAMAAGVRTFILGALPRPRSESLRTRPDGPFLETREHSSGF